MKRFLPVLALLVACNDATVKYFNSPPSVAISAPADGTKVNPGDLVEFYGVARDEQDVSADVLVSWTSDIDGEFDTTPGDDNGDLYVATSLLSTGAHAITLTATDTDGESASTSIGLQVGEGTSGVPGAPIVVIVGPTEGEQIGASTPVNLVATVTDDKDLFDTLAVEVIDSVDGSVWTGNPTSAGAVSLAMDPTVGAHALVVSAVDSEGKVGTATVNFEVVPDDRPIVNITGPKDGAAFLTTDTITFRGTVADDITPKELLSLTWTSDISGTFSTTPADSNGDTSVGIALPGGTHTITLAAFDADAKDGRDSIVVVVTDPRDIDDDHDGYTENGGDCDDDDPLLNPGEVEICDDYDNDCSGYINDPWFDTYEVNNSLSTAYNAGDVDSAIGWANSTLTLAGLTLSDETDEDWVKWDADDELYDNVTVEVIVTGLPSKGTYVVELYDSGSGTLIDSDSGPGNSGLTISFEGDVFDTDEDDWAVRVYSAKWPSNTCDSTYTLKIKS